MAKRRWINPRTGRPISEQYEKRLRRSGIRRGQYETGEVSSKRLRRARGHAQTPERPARATRQPSRFPRYSRRNVPIRVMTNDGPYLVRGLNVRDRQKVARHWNAVGKALDSGSDKPLDRYRGAYVGGYDGVEIEDIDQVGEGEFRPINRIFLADTMEEIEEAIELDLPLSFEALYEES